MALLSASFSGGMMFVYVAAAAVALLSVGLFVHWLDRRVQRMRGMADPPEPIEEMETGKARHDMRSATPAKPSRAAFGISASGPAPPSPARVQQALRTPLEAASPGADARTTEQSPYQIPNPPDSPRMPPPVASASARPSLAPQADHGNRPSSRLSVSLSPLREAEA